jgi:hypothetical protein
VHFFDVMVADRYAGETFASVQAARHEEFSLNTKRATYPTNGNGRPTDVRTGARRKATAKA